MSRCLRSACARDYDACIALFQRSVDQLTAEHYDAEQRRAWAPPDPDRTLWHRRLATLQLCLLEDNGQLAGFIGYSLDGHIDLLYCAPESARKGVASELYLAAERHLRGVGVTRLWTEASLAALPFFQAHGFRLIARQPVQRDGVSLLRCDMDKVLTG